MATNQVADGGEKFVIPIFPFGCRAGISKLLPAATEVRNQRFSTLQTLPLPTAGPLPDTTPLCPAHAGRILSI
jgi:hypothetical protein